MPGVRITSLRPKREHLSPSDRCSLLFERQIPNLLASKANRLLWAFFTKRCRRQSKRVRKGAAVEILRQKERKFRAPQEAAEPKMPGGSNHLTPIIEDRLSGRSSCTTGASLPHRGRLSFFSANFLVTSIPAYFMLFASLICRLLIKVPALRSYTPFALSFSYLQIEDNSDFLVFIVFHYLRGLFVFVIASAISMVQNHHLALSSSQASRTGTSS